MKKFLKDAFVWGVALWLIGYILGILLFAVVAPEMIGWIIMPIGILITLWVVIKKVYGTNLSYYFGVGIIWMVLAIVLDYLFLVLVFKPTDGYYKLDVYIYYILTLLLPLLVGLRKTRVKSIAS